MATRIITRTRKVDVSVETDRPNFEHTVRGPGGVAERFQYVGDGSNHSVLEDQKEAVRLFVRWFWGLADDAEVTVEFAHRYGPSCLGYTATFQKTEHEYLL